MSKKKTLKEQLDELPSDHKFEQEHAFRVEAHEPSDLEKIEKELSEISPTLSKLKRNDPAKYKEAYKRFMWLVGERDRLKAEHSLSTGYASL